MLNIQATVIPDKEKDKIIASWSAKIPTVADKLTAAKSDEDFRLAILEAHEIAESDLNIRVGG